MSNKGRRRTELRQATPLRYLLHKMAGSLYTTTDLSTLDDRVYLLDVSVLAQDFLVYAYF
jgi:hypothetical protein